MSRRQAWLQDDARSDEASTISLQPAGDQWRTFKPEAAFRLLMSGDRDGTPDGRPVIAERLRDATVDALIHQVAYCGRRWYCMANKMTLVKK